MLFSVWIQRGLDFGVYGEGRLRYPQRRGLLLPHRYLIDYSNEYNPSHVRMLTFHCSVPIYTR
jgi:hypothetical protein